MFNDFSKAFDCVQHKLLLYVLLTNLESCRFHNILKSMYAGLKAVTCQICLAVQSVRDKDACSARYYSHCLSTSPYRWAGMQGVKVYM
jgi:hypothetical protein